MRLVLILISRQLPAGPGGGAGTGGTGLDAAVAFPWVPVLLLAVPAAVAVGLLWMYFRTARRMRRAQLAPPVWLLPYLEQQVDEPKVWPPTESSEDVAADLAERTESVGRLARRKRAILVGLALNFVAGWAMAGAYLYDARSGGEFQQLPPTSMLGSSVDTAGFDGLEPGAPGQADSPDPGIAAAPPTAGPEPLDTAEARRRNEQRLAFFRRRDSLAQVARNDSIARAAEVANRVRDSIAQVVRDSLARAAAANSAPPIAPPPPPPPPPPAPPPPDPAVELARVRDVLTGGARSLAGSMGSSQEVPEQVAPAASRQRFAEFLSENRPAVSLVSLDEPVLQEGRAASVLVLQFQWRGSFGDTRRRTVRFRAEASRTGTVWRVTSFTALDNPP